MSVAVLALTLLGSPGSNASSQSQEQTGTSRLTLQQAVERALEYHPSLRMAEALLEIRHPYRLIMFEGGDHGLSEFRREVDDAVGAWLDRYVRDGESWPSLEPHGR